MLISLVLYRTSLLFFLQKYLSLPPISLWFVNENLHSTSPDLYNI